MVHLCHSPFIAIGSLDAAIICDVSRFLVVGVEEEENVRVETRIGDNHHANNGIQYFTPSPGAPGRKLLD